MWSNTLLLDLLWPTFCLVAPIPVLEHAVTASAVTALQLPAAFSMTAVATGVKMGLAACCLSLLCFEASLTKRLALMRVAPGLVPLALQRRCTMH